MKISSIEIENFKGIKNMALKPKHVNVFLGRNGSGKSAILSAIAFALTGKIKPEYIRQGTEALSVTLMFEDGTSIKRTRTHKETLVRCNGKRTTGKSVNQFLKEKLGADGTTYEALCGIDYLKSLSSKDLSGLFLSILPMKVSLDKFCQIADAICREEFFSDMDKDTKKYLKEILKEDIFGMPEMTAAYKIAFEERRNEKVVVKNLISRSEFKKELPKESEEDLKKELNRIAESEAAMKNYKKQLKLYENSAKQADVVKMKKDQLEENLKAYQNVTKPDEKKREQAEIDKKKFEDAIKKRQDLIGRFESNNDLLRRTLQSLDQPICPISSKLICTTDKSGLKEEFQKMLKRNEDYVNEQKDFIERCEEQIEKRNQIIDKYNQYLLLFSKKENLETQIKNLIIPEILPKPEPMEEKDYESLKEEVHKKMAIYGEYKGVLEAQKEFEVENKRLKTLEIAVRVLDVKKGVPMEILKVALANFESAANKKATSIKQELQLSISYNDGINILAKTKDHNGFLPLDVISTGEYTLVAFLLMDIINQITDAKYLVIDNMDALDTENTKMFIDMLNKESSYEHIFIGAVDHEDTKNTVPKDMAILVNNP